MSASGTGTGTGPAFCKPEDPNGPVEKVTGGTLTGRDAQDQCNIVSSEADKIRAANESAGQAVATALSLGLNGLWTTTAEARTNIRNILKIDMSECEIALVKQSCSQLSKTTQLNELDFRCSYCQKYGCKVENIRQTNKSVTNQACVMQSLIDIISKKKATQDTSTALALLQKVQGGASTKSDTEICNNFSVNMSSKSFIDTQQNCAQAAYGDQTNRFYGCGDARGILQSNIIESYQSCMAGNDISKESDMDSGQKSTTEVKIQQEAVGVMASSVSSGGFFMILLVVGAVFFMMMMKGKN